MKNYAITILWTIIISGSIFVITNKLKNENKTPQEIIPPEIINEDPVKSITTDPIIVEDNSEINYLEHIEKGNKLLEDGYIDSAIEEYLQAAQKNPTSASTIKKLADTYLKNNQAENAETYYRKAQELAPKSTEITMGIAKSLLNQGKYDEAKNIIWELPIENLEARFYQGLTLIIYDKKEEAQKIFEEIYTTEQKIDPKLKENVKLFLDSYTKFDYFTDSDPLFLDLMLASSFSMIEEYNTAIKLLFDIINQKNNYRDAWLVIGYSYLNINKNADAIEALLQAKELDQEKPETLFYLGLAYYANEETEKAIFYLEKAKTNGFKPIDIIDIKLAELYKVRKNFKKSAALYEKLIKTNKNLNLYAEAIKINIDELNDIQKAISLSKKAVTLFPESAMSHYLLAWAYLENSDFTQAKKYLSNSINLDPSLAEAYLGTGKYNEKLGNYVLAKEYYKQAFVLGKGQEIATIAANNYNTLNKINTNKNYQINISQP